LSDSTRKDTTLVPAGHTVDILLDVTNPGDWMFHCHILEHAEVGMMAHIMVLGDGDTMGH
jgi:FtsP/CotA-like multicopper oxidase with cupredoxin domain